MGIFKIWQRPAIVGGSVDIGADVNLYRSAADLLKTDDGLEIAGTVGLLGAFTHFKSGLGTVTIDAGTVTVRKHTALGGTTTIDGGTVSSVTVGGTVKTYGGTATVGAASFGTVTLTPGTATIVDVGGTAKIAGGTVTVGVVTLGTVILSPGTVSCRDAAGTTELAGGYFVAPYAAAAPAPTVNGQLSVYHSTFLPHFTMRSGGTVYTITFPTTTHGTITVTIGTPPD